jgi:hypothetical protein
MSNPPELPPRLETPPAAAGSDGDLAGQVAELTAVVAELHERHRSTRLRPLEIVLIVLLGVSLLVHALTVSELLRVRSTLRGELDSLAERIVAAKGTPLTYTLPIDQQLPVNVDVPIKRALQVPVNLNVPIKQNITVPINTGLGSIDVPVALDTTVPISTTVPIALDQTLNISTTVPIRLDLPLQIDLGSAQLAPYLDQLRDRLIELRDSL